MTVEGRWLISLIAGTPLAITDLPPFHSMSAGEGATSAYTLGCPLASDLWLFAHSTNAVPTPACVGRSADQSERSH